RHMDHSAVTGRGTDEVVYETQSVNAPVRRRRAQGKSKNLPRRWLPLGTGALQGHDLLVADALVGQRSVGSSENDALIVPAPLVARAPKREEVARVQASNSSAAELHADARDVFDVDRLTARRVDQGADLGDLLIGQEAKEVQPMATEPGHDSSTRDIALEQPVRRIAHFHLSGDH